MFFPGDYRGRLELLKLPHANLEEVELLQQQQQSVRLLGHASNLHFQPVFSSVLHCKKNWLLTF